MSTLWLDMALTFFVSGICTSSQVLVSTFHWTVSSFNDQLASCFSVTFITSNYIQAYKLIETNEVMLAEFETSTHILWDSFVGYLEEEQAFLLTIKSTPASEENEMVYFKWLVKLWACEWVWNSHSWICYLMTLQEANWGRNCKQVYEEGASKSMRVERLLFGLSTSSWRYIGNWWGSKMVRRRCKLYSCPCIDWRCQVSKGSGLGHGTGYSVFDGVGQNGTFRYWWVWH